MEADVLTLMVLKADASGLFGFGHGYLSRKLHTKHATVRSAIDALKSIGVVDEVSPPGRHTPAVYRVRVSRMAAMVAQGGTVAAGSRTHPGRASTHRIQVAEDETRHLLDATRHRLAELEALLAADEPPKDANQHALWMNERDSLELDMIPRLESHLDLYRGDSRQKP